MSTLTALRDQLRADLNDFTRPSGKKLRAVSYIGSEIHADGVIVAPGRPYVRDDEDDLTFGEKRVRVDLILPVSQDTGEKEAAQADRLIEDTLSALDGATDGWELESVAQPGTATLRGAKYLASVVTVRLDTRF